MSGENNNGNKGAVFFAILLLLAIGGSVFFYLKDRKHRQEITDLKATKTALLKDTIEYYEAKNGQLVATIERVVLEKKETDLYNTKIKDDLKNMKIKLRDAELYISTNITNNTKPPDIPLIDTIIIEKEKIVAAKAFSWSDRYGGMGGIIVNNIITQPYYYSRDTIAIAGKKVYKFKFLGIGFKVIGASLSVTNVNPNSQVSSPMYVKLE